MKRYVKIIGLAALLALCLLLAGCHQSPDETNSPHFNTLPPEQVVTSTPEPQPAETQNLFGDDTGFLPDETETDKPAENGWNIPWGDDSGLETDTPDAEETYQPDYPDIETVTSAPVTEMPSAEPSPTPKSLQRGFTDSEDVREMQKKLKELGYYKGSADGDFGAGTEDAVIAFQKANGLTADGKAGPKTLEKLYGSNAVSAKSASSDSSASTSSSAGKISKDTYLDSGKKGKDVKTLQNRLIELGWLSGSASGTYDEATEAAVIAFQKKAKLWADGKAGPKTIEALFSSKAPSGSSSSGATLELGSEGSEVKKLQKRLIDLGYLSGTADGKFGEMTETALKAFQEANGLEADGKAGTKTQNKLFSDEAVKASTTSD